MAKAFLYNNYRFITSKIPKNNSQRMSQQFPEELHPMQKKYFPSVNKIKALSFILFLSTQRKQVEDKMK
jgi:hypothetical protein